MLEPFLKWAGGKRWLVQRYVGFMPVRFNRYFEPFLGSGAVFFHLLPSRAVLADINPDLIEAYRAIRDNWRAVLRYLRVHHANHKPTYYYRIRDSRPVSPYVKAARLIYLNRTCFNGLYRVNKEGVFNVPKGTKNTVLFPDDDFCAIAHALKMCELLNEDFARVISRAGEGDFVYADPPYTMKHNNNNFIKYNEMLFTWQDQLRLAETLHGAKNRGAMIVLSNADHPSITSLYAGFGKITRIHRHSVLAADSKKRRGTTELIITNI